MTDDRRAQGERRNHADRRRGTGPRGYLLRLLKGERRQLEDRRRGLDGKAGADRRSPRQTATDLVRGALDRKSTRLNSSHITISYAVFCLKKKTTTNTQAPIPD